MIIERYPNHFNSIVELIDLPAKGIKETIAFIEASAINLFLIFI
jgi:hypothetical protein